jgi:hypothetical protein
MTMFHETFKHLIASQYEASLCTLWQCVARCPDAQWNAPVARYPFCQVAFHTLFFVDYYLSQDAEAFMSQLWHQEHQELFGDYEQLQDREPTSLYTRAQLELYTEYCRDKAATVIAEETEATLAAEARFPRKPFSRAELHVYNIRHIQHHAAQLILRLRVDTDVDVPWVRSGWKDQSPEIEKLAS